MTTIKKILTDKEIIVMFRNAFKKSVQTEAQVSAPVGVLWFIHDTPGITEKVPYTNENNLLSDIQKFYARYGADHQNEFMVIFTDPTNEELVAKIENIVGAEYGICDMMTQPRLFR